MTHKPPILDIPIFHKSYDLFKLLNSYHKTIPKTGRFSLWLRCENTALTILEAIIETSQQKGEERFKSLQFISLKLDLLKVLIRLAQDTKTITNKQYLAIQTILHEIGRMVGGWIKSVPH